MAAAAISNFGKNVNNSGLNKGTCTKFCGKMHHGYSEMITWPKVETGRQFAWRHQMNVWRISESISVTITDIWTIFGTEHKYHTINTPEWPNSHNLKIQDGGCRHLGFRKNINNCRLDKKYLHKILLEDPSRPCGDDHRTKSRNRKFIHVTLSNKSQKHKCVDLSDYNIYLNQIWYRAQIPHYKHAGMVKFT